MEEQRTLGWFKSRIGNITGSQVGLLMVKGRAKDAVFGQTAMAYILQLAAERTMKESVLNDDDLFAQYVEYTSVSSKAMQWGTEQEAMARLTYQDVKRVKVDETGSVRHATIPYFASSPDGIVGDGCIEIKCPNQATYIEYATEIIDGASLKAVESKYYWQVMAHMSCTGAKWCDFVAYSPWQSKPIHIAHIERDEEAIAEMESRVILANEEIDKLVEKLTK